MKTFIILAALLITSSITEAQWEPCNNGMDDKTVLSITVIGNKIFAGTVGGLFVSSDNGDNWGFSDKGLTSYVLSMAVSGNTIFAATRRSGIFLSTDGGANWTAKNNGLTVEGITRVAIIGTNIFAGSMLGGMFLSTDNGESWSARNNGFPSDTVTALVVNGNDIYAGTSGIFRSSNNGDSWTELKRVAQVMSVVVRGNTIYAGALGSGVLVSTNSGISWTPKNNDLTDLSVEAIVFLGNNILTATYNGGMFLSTDNGDNWTRKNTGLTGYKFRTMTTDGKYVYAGTYGGGMYRAKVSDFNSVNAVETIKENAFSLYPNPVRQHENLHIYSPTHGCTSIILRNTLGVTVYEEKKLNNSENGNSVVIPTANLSPSLYYLTVTSGHVTETRKLAVIR
jgi:photosystem II stability/assembly factor-like uncharacterized protein